MALSPMGTQADQESATQETMFEDSNDFAGLEAYEAAEESPYEPAESFPEGTLESTSAASGDESATAHAGGDNPEVASEVGKQAAQPENPPAVAPEPAAATEPETMSVLTVDDFSALEERILRAVNLVRRERQARVAAEERTAALEVEVQAQVPAIERLQQEVDSLRAERDQVRLRIERLLSQLDAMDM